jgi:hypothetical protein
MKLCDMDRGSITGRVSQRGGFSSPKRPDRLRSPLSPLFNVLLAGQADGMSS